MKLPRAAHTATVLKNGKVFVAGGFNYAMGGQTRVALSETELYNPATNAFETTSREMAVSSGMQKLPKAFHTATALQIECVAVNGKSRADARATMMAAIARLKGAIATTVGFTKGFAGTDTKLIVLPEYFLSSFPMG